MERGESNEQLANSLVADDGRRLSEDQYRNAVRTIRAAVDDWRYSVGVKRGGGPSGLMSGGHPIAFDLERLP